MQSQCNRVLFALKQGQAPGEALVTLPVIHPRYHWIISVYGLSRDAKSAYKTIAGEMVDSTQDFIKSLFGLYVKNITLVLLGVALGWIYLSVLGIAAPPNL